MRTIDTCSCSCCSAPSDRDKSDDCSATLRMHAVTLRNALLARRTWVRHQSRFPVGGIVDNQGDFGGVLVGERVGASLLYRRHGGA